MGYLSGAVGYDVAARRPVDGALASRIVALDVFAVNVDRTARNPNLLWQGGELWLIDHGAALYWHHGWDGSEESELAARRRARSGGSESTSVAVRRQLPAAGAGAGGGVRRRHGSRARSMPSPSSGWRARGAAELRAAYGTWLRARRAALPKILDEANRVRASRV